MSAVVETDNIELPKNWVTLPISELGTAITGNTPPTKNAENYGGELPFIKPTELVDKAVISGRETISEIGAKNARILPKGGVLVSCIGYLGKTAIAKREVAFNQQINAIVFNEAVLPEYGFYYFQSPRFRKDLESLASGTTISIVNKSKFESINIPLAPPEQQKRIVAKIEELFSHIDAGIEALKKAKQLLKQYRQSVLKAAVTGELTKEWREANISKLEPASKLLERILKERRQKWEEQQLDQFKVKGKTPKDDKWKGKYKEPLASDVDFKIPQGWAETTTDQVYFYVTSGSRGWAKYYSEEGPVFLRMGNLDHYDVTLDLDDIQRVNPPKGAEGSRTRVQAGDSLISITADVGMVGIVPENFEEAYINQHVSLARPVLPEMGLYLAWLLSGDFSKEQFKVLQRGATKVGLGLDDIKSIQFGLPSIKEQNEIVRVIEDKLGAMERLDYELDIKLLKAEKNKQSILASAFSGTLVDSREEDGDAGELLSRIRESRFDDIEVKKYTKKSQKKSRGKSVKKPIIDVLTERGEVAVSALMQEAGYEQDQVESFYDDLSLISDSIIEIRPEGERINGWPYESEVKLKLK